MSRPLVDRLDSIDVFNIRQSNQHPKDIAKQYGIGAGSVRRLKDDYFFWSISWRDEWESDVKAYESPLFPQEPEEPESVEEPKSNLEWVRECDLILTEFKGKLSELVTHCPAYILDALIADTRSELDKAHRGEIL